MIFWKLPAYLEFLIKILGTTFEFAERHHMIHSPFKDFHDEVLNHSLREQACEIVWGNSYSDFVYQHARIYVSISDTNNLLN